LKARRPRRVSESGASDRAAVPRFIVSFSGGLDSTVLLHLCAVFFGPESLLAVHVNHGLQAAAKAFEAQAKRTCQSWGVRLKVQTLQASPGKGESVEAWARAERYQALSAIAKQHAIEHVFTAHHQDDQVETLLIALSRGAGIEGLRGIAPNRPLGEAVLHRPLLECARVALQSYAVEHQLEWVEDPSNQDPRFLRNRIRRDLLPRLQSTLPGFAAQASRSMGHLRQALMHRPGGSVNLSPSSSPSVSLSRKSLQAQGEAQQAIMLRAWLRQQNLQVPSQAKLAEIRKQLIASQTPSVSIAHDGKQLRRERDRLWVEGGQSQQAGLGQQTSQSRVFDSKASQTALERTPQGWIWPLPKFRGSLLIKDLERHRVGGLDRASYVAPPNPATLQIASPRSSQKMQLDPNTPRKTLKNLFQASGIPSELRKRLPCVTHGEDVLFVAGLGTAQNSPWKFEFLPDL
jgi:tRNA(Ile)-lysidine synthase